MRVVVSGCEWRSMESERNKGKSLFDKRAGRCGTVSSAHSTGSVVFRNNFFVERLFMGCFSVFL